MRWVAWVEISRLDELLAVGSSRFHRECSLFYGEVVLNLQVNCVL